MPGDTRFLYTCIYIDLVSAIASRLHALNKEIKKKNNNNIIEGGRTRRGAHAVAVKNATTSLNAYHTAFAAFIPSQLFYSAVLATMATKKLKHSEPLRMHCDYLPAEPDN